MDLLATLITAGQFFVVIAAELVLLFVGITFLVGLLQAYIPEERIRRVLAGRREGVGNVLAAGFGALTPFCSCSTIPILLGLLDIGIPFGVCMSFLFASPLLNPVILALLVALVGVVPTAIYAAVTFPAAVVIGWLLGRLGYERYVKDVMVEGRPEPCDCAAGHAVRIRGAFSFAVSLFKQVFPYLLLGAGIGAFIYGFIPEDLIVSLAGPDNPLAIPVAAVIGVPMYIRAETLIPVSAVLLEKGMGIGAVMALIIGGAGASIPEVTLLSAIFERRLVAAFVATILTVAVLAGVLFQVLSVI
ncbi:MAG: Permease [Methanoculleus marisnigri]|jgi:Predicted permeases|uniref:Permease n=1 Tax=Methanoculleus marisnigri TaxID=2198 RepID=A0A101GLA1_9EURY|nr:permease [Methanoculleus marisnigri]KUK60518.1 MAG: Permease [Methanoculleus marisnigri]KUL01177.1 MAG: Permease [Methanoculleus marisnigri]